MAEGREEGREEGRAEGREVVRRAIRSVCATLDVPWTDARRPQLAAMDLPALEALLVGLARDRAWPS